MVCDLTAYNVIFCAENDRGVDLLSQWMHVLYQHMYTEYVE
jgi:hypothetical protein